LKTLSPHDRPREKLSRSGASGLGDNELLAIVLGHGSRRGSALDLANAILEAGGGLHGVVRLSVDELRHVYGIGHAKAAQVLAALELGRRTLSREPRKRPQFASPREVADYLIPEHGSWPVEQFGVLLLDTKHRMLRTAILSVGTLDASIVHPREVFRVATAAGAAAIVLFHNHPSGDPSPSPDDIALTRRMVHAGEIMGIDVVDHLILTETGYHSMKERLRV
jgi:DNA repair protein RadC